MNQVQCSSAVCSSADARLPTLTDRLGEEHDERRPEDANELPLQTFGSWRSP
jgi:hypothetical protein